MHEPQTTGEEAARPAIRVLDPPAAVGERAAREVLGVVDLSDCGILGIFWDTTDRKKVEQKLKRYQKALKAPASKITSVEEQEREKCAAFLHDSIGQTLSLVKMKLGMLSKSIDLKDHKADVDAIRTIVNHLIEDTRFLTSELTPPILHQLGLSAGLEWLVDQMSERESMMIQFEDDGQAKSLDKNASIMLFRSVQELLINIVKHAKAQKSKSIS